MQIRVVRHAAILFVATVMMAAVGCTPTGSGGPAAGSTELITSKCTMCHTIDRINQANKDQAGWEQTIARMRTKGAQLTDAEAAQIAEYLAAQSAGK